MNLLDKIRYRNRFTLDEIKELNSIGLIISGDGNMAGNSIDDFPWNPLCHKKAGRLVTVRENCSCKKSYKNSSSTT